MKKFNNIKYKKALLFFLLIFSFIVLIIVIINNTNINFLHSIKTSVGIWNKEKEEEIKKDYIKWVSCNLTMEIIDKTSKLDIESHINNEEIKLNWIEIISYLACRYGNDFNKLKQKDLDNIVEKLKNGTTMEEITRDLEYYSYYFKSYSAVLGEFIGEYEIQEINESGEKVFVKKYGLKAFLPIAKGYNFSHYDDFGDSRSYGFKRTHLGNDLMGSIGTPIIAVESGIVEACRVESVWWLENRN